MKKALLFVVLGCAALAVSAQAALTADQIVEKSRDRIKADTVQTRSRMVITDKKGATTERVIDQFSKDDAAGNGRAMIVFQSPASVKGTRFLTLEHKDSESDQWIYLPELGKTRRIAGSAKSGDFMGTDMSYDDIDSANRAADKDTHRLLREEQYAAGGISAACHVIESVPKDSGYQYSKMVSWIDKATFVSYKIEMYDKKGALVKTMEMADVKDVQGRLTPMRTKVSTVARGTSTTIYVEQIKYDSPIPEAVFTTQYLETGRAR